MTEENIIGQFVILDENYIKAAYLTDDNVPIKSARPYLIVKLNGKTKSQLFAIPVQTNVPKSIKPEFFEKLPRRLDTRTNCDSGLMIGQMLPISLNQVKEKKSADSIIPRSEEKRNIILQNLWFGNANNWPENSRQSFAYLQKKVIGYGMSIFQNKQFQQFYKINARAIFDEVVKEKNRKLSEINQKAQNYLENHYMKFLREKVYQKNKDSEVVMPTRFTRIDKLIKFLHQYNTEIKTKELQEKYKLTDSQYETIKRVYEKTLKEQKCMTIEKAIRSAIYMDEDGHYDPAVKAQVTAEIEQARAAKKQAAKPVANQAKTQEKIDDVKPKKRPSGNSK